MGPAAVWDLCAQCPGTRMAPRGSAPPPLPSDQTGAHGGARPWAVLPTETPPVLSSCPRCPVSTPPREALGSTGNFLGCGGRDAWRLRAPGQLLGGLWVCGSGGRTGRSDLGGVGDWLWGLVWDSWWIPKSSLWRGRELGARGGDPCDAANSDRGAVSAPLCRLVSAPVGSLRVGCSAPGSQGGGVGPHLPRVCVRWCGAVRVRALVCAWVCVHVWVCALCVCGKEQR